MKKQMQAVRTKKNSCTKQIPLVALAISRLLSRTASANQNQQSCTVNRKTANKSTSKFKFRLWLSQARWQSIDTREAEEKLKIEQDNEPLAVGFFEKMFMFPVKPRRSVCVWVRVSFARWDRVVCVFIGRSASKV